MTGNGNDRHLSDLRASLPPTLEAVEAFCTECRRRLGAAATSRECFIAELLLREVLTNAVAHGARSNPGAPVFCAVRLDRSRITLVVRDQGKGFDWRTMWNRPPDDDADSGRGMQILRTYANRVRFNACGTVVAVTRKFKL
jgi:anti-sigma regulatory factor (Ser/Thr protein kinase)